MLLVPLVENAFKHGISLAGKSWINITLACDETQIRFTVANSVHAKTGTDPEKNNTGIGLKNVQERLRLLYPQKHILDIKKNDNQFTVQMIITP
jgi:LytS/YehU family sensor histidine kinase